MAIAESLTKRTGGEWSLYYIGPDPYDQSALDRYKLTFVRTPAGKRRRYASLRNFLDIWKTFFGVFIAIFRLFVIYPDVIMSKGSYTSVPVTIAGWLLRIPIVVHESDAVPGSANKMASHFARYVAVSYPGTAEHFPTEKTAHTGIPIRTELLVGPAAGKGQELGFAPGLPVILILGGSQGAERINELILRTLDKLLLNFSVVHQTGKSHFDITTASARGLIPDQELLSHYHPVAFLEATALNEVMHTADLIISRAGSGTIFEISIHAKPAILIPIPEEISHDQRTNAYAYARRGAATVMEEHNLEAGLLAAEINRIMGDKGMYQSMQEAARTFAPRDAGEKLATTLIEIGEEHW
jgi:UDP-N-acetylglucosamine--N-acetylmuramyl-(pentapeptide) pyrophosphoryl-undecaprenol N-acetylglucosamine transferase